MPEKKEIEAVFYKDDPRRRAPKIKCEVCNNCRWHDPMNSNMCIYGGPYKYDYAPVDRPD